MTEYQTIKPRAGVPITVELRYCDYAKTTKPEEGYPDQICLKGTVDGQDGRLYLPLGVQDQLTAKGYVKITGENDNWGNPAYRVLNPGPFELLKSERDGGKGWTWTVGSLNGDQDSPPKTEHSPANPTATPKADWRTFLVQYRDAEIACIQTTEQAWTRAGYKPEDVIAEIGAGSRQKLIELSKRGYIEQVDMKRAKPEPTYEEPPAALEEEEDELPF